MGATEFSKHQITNTRIKTIYNQFYAIKDLSFMSSFLNALNMVLVSQTNTKLSSQSDGALNSFQESVSKKQSDFNGSANEFLISNRILERLKNFTLSHKYFLRNFVSNDTISLVNGMKLTDNCPLIDDKRVACFDNTSNTIFHFGLQSYYTYAWSTYNMLTAYLNSTEAAQSSAETILKSLPFRQLFSLQSLNFP